MNEFCTWLSGTPVSQWLARIEWLVPMVQSIHILGIAAVATALALLDLGVLRGRADAQAAERLARPLRAGLWTLAGSGVLLTVIEPARELMNNLFRIKLALLPLLLWTAFWMLRRLRQGQPAGRGWALVNLALLLSMVGLGRFIAYV